MLARFILIIFGLFLVVLLFKSDLLRSGPEEIRHVELEHGEPVTWADGTWKVYAKRNFQSEPLMYKIEDSFVTFLPDGKPLQFRTNRSSDSEVIISATQIRENFSVKRFPFPNRIQKLTDDKMIFWIEGSTPERSNIFFAERVSTEDL